VTPPDVTPASTTPLDRAPVETFVVVGTIRDDTNLADLAALRADEQKQLEVLQAAGKIGAHHVAAARRTVFLEVMATEEEQVRQTLATLPFYRFFDLDIYSTAAPAGPPHA
jgi:muconolactone delta-isomerase